MNNKQFAIASGISVRIATGRLDCISKRADWQACARMIVLYYNLVKRAIPVYLGFVAMLRDNRMCRLL